MASASELIAEGLESGKDTKSYKLATEYKQKLENGIELTEKEIKNLVKANSEAITAEDVATLSEEDAALFKSVYDGKTDKGDFFNSFELVKTLTENNYSADYILEHKGVLSAKQVSAIYKAKVLDSDASLEKAITALKEKHEGTDFIEGTFDDSVINYENTNVEGKVNWNSLKSNQKKAIVVLGQVGKRTGMDVVLISDGLERGINGAFEISGNKMLIDIYAGMDKVDGSKLQDTIIPTASHEMTHWMKFKSPELYRKYDNYVFGTLTMSGKSESDILSARRKKMEDAHPGEKFTDAEVRDEVIARASEDMFAKSEEIKKFLNTLTDSEKKSFVEKVKEILQNVKEWLNDFFPKQKSTSDEAKIIMQYADRIDGQIKLWDEMLLASIEANQALKKEGITGEELAKKVTNKTSNEGDMQFAERDNSEMTDEDYFKLLSKKAINVSKVIKAKIDQQRISRYANMSEEQIPIVDIFRVADYNKVNVAYKYTVRNDSKDYFTVIRKQQIKAESIPHNLNKIIQEEIENARANKSISEARNGRNNNSLGNNVLGDGEKLQENDNVVTRSEQANQERHNAQGISNIRRGVKNSDRDTLGNTLTEAQQFYFVESKVRDENGSALKYNENSPLSFENRASENSRSSINWVYKAKIFSQVENKLFHQKISEINQGSNAFVKNSTGEYMLPIENKIVFTDGNYDSPYISEILEVLTEYSTEFEDVKERIFNVEKGKSGKQETAQVITDFYGDGIVLSYRDGVIGVYAWETGRRKGSTRRTVISNYLRKQDRGRNDTESKETSIKYSDRDNVSLYDTLGETDRLIKENTQLKEDVERLKERLKLERRVTHGNYFNENQLDTVAGHIRKLANSDFSKKELISNLKEIYSYIAHSPDLNWQDMFAQCYDIAQMVLDESRPITVENDYFKMVLKDLRGTKISVSEGQKKDAKYRLGNRWRNAFFNKITITDNGISLDSQWKEWAAEYPDIFDAEISDADMLVELYDIYDNLREGSEIVVEYDIEERTRWLAREIYNQYWNVSPIRTTADKYDKQIKRLNLAHRKAMQEFRDNYEERLAEQKKAERQRAKDLIRNIRECKDKEIAEVKKYSKERMDAYKERAERKTKIQNITANALTLNKWLTTNSKDYHIHEAMKEPVIKLLQSIDFSSKRMLEKNILTQKDVSFTEAFADVKAMLIKADNMEAGLEELYGHDLAEDIERLVQASYNIIGDNNYVINEMSLEELKSLDILVKYIKKVVTQFNKFHTLHHNKGAIDLANTFIEYGDKLGKLKKQDGKIGKFLRFKNCTPYYFFKRLGEAGRKLFEAFQDGWDKLAFNVAEIIDFTNDTYTDKEVQQWGKETKTFTLPQPDGSQRTFEMTIAQIMALHCVSKQEDALRHLLSKGMTLSRLDKKGNVVADYENILLSESNLNTILSTLDKMPRAKEVANKLQEFMNTVCSDWGNAISMARFGVKMFTNPNYFPIKVSPAQIPTDNTKEFDNASLFRLLNMSFTKARNKFADQSIEIGDIFDIFAQHTTDMAKYNALALPVLDFNKFYSYKFNDTTGKEYGVDNTLRMVFGNEAVRYLKTFIRDINGSQNVSRDVIGKTFFKNAKLSSVANNLRVVLLQPTAYFKAGAVMNNKYLLEAPIFSIGKLKKSIAKAEKYCGIIKWKSLGYYDTDISKGIAEKVKHANTFKDKAIEISMKGAEIADKVTFGVIWNACEIETRKTHKDLKVGSEEFYQAAARRLREIVYGTQVVDSTMTRTDMMRSADSFDKVLTTFGSEPMIAYNMLMDAAMQYNLDKKTLGKKEARKKNGKKIHKVITAYAMTNVVAALIESGFDVFRDDEEEEMDLEEFTKLYFKNFVLDMSIGNKLPFVKELYSAIQGYSSSRMDAQWMEYLVGTITTWGKVFAGEEGQGDKAIKNVLKMLSSVPGYAFYNVYRDLMALLYKLDILDTEEIEELFD